MSDDQFTKLFKYMERRFNAVDDRYDELKAELKAEINLVYNLLDKHVKQQEVDEQERLAIVHHLDQHERWIIQAAKRLDLSYKR